MQGTQPGASCAFHLQPAAQLAVSRPPPTPSLALPCTDPALLPQGHRSCSACTARMCSGMTWSVAMGQCTCPLPLAGRFLPQACLPDPHHLPRLLQPRAGRHPGGEAAGEGGMAGRCRPHGWWGLQGPGQALALCLAANSPSVQTCVPGTKRPSPCSSRSPHPNYRSSPGECSPCVLPARLPAAGLRVARGHAAPSA